jgi:hypothetical protein
MFRHPRLNLPFNQVTHAPHMSQLFRHGRGIKDVEEGIQIYTEVLVFA